MNPETYDLVVIGGGTAGSAAASAAHKAGAKVVMFNDEELGGLCILRGCMPTKTMLHAAHLAHHAEHHPTAGVSKHKAEIDFPAIMANKDAVVKRFQKAKIEGIERAGYQVVLERAQFIAEDLVEAGGKTYRFTKGAVLATGSTVAVPPIPGIEETPYITSDEVMQLKEPPKSLIVIGSGAIGLELSQFFARIRSEVQLVSRRPLLCDIDPDFSAEMMAVFKNEPNLTLTSPCTIKSVSRKANQVQLTAETEQGVKTIVAEKLLLATGRKPNLENLGLEKLGLTLEKGKIAHSADMRSSNPKIFVAGDSSGAELLLHVANWEGRVAGLNAIEPDTKREVEQRLRMSAIFSDPPFATVGLNISEAASKDIEIVSATIRFPETGRAITQDTDFGLAKLIARAKQGERKGEILGAQILGPRADDLIHIVGSIMYYRGKANHMLSMPWYHPTLSEVLLTLAREINEKIEL